MTNSIGQTSIIDKLKSYALAAGVAAISTMRRTFDPNESAFEARAHARQALSSISRTAGEALARQSHNQAVQFA